jgi:hypothetical protein
MADDLIHPVLLGMLGCAATALHPPPGRALVSPGPVAWDDCCDGQVWVRLVSLAPIPAATQPCGVTMWQANIAVGVLRCASVLDDQGVAPPAARITAEAGMVSQDATNLAHAIQCCMCPLAERINISNWVSLGPEGGCVGGEWMLTALIPNCRCEDH